MVAKLLENGGFGNVSYSFVVTGMRLTVNFTTVGISKPKLTFLTAAEYLKGCDIKGILEILDINVLMLLLFNYILKELLD